MQIEPRARFQASEHAKPLHDAVATTWFHAGAEAAMLECQADMGAPENVGTAAACALRLQGAKMFLDKLMSLTEPPKPRVVRNTRDNLNPV